MTEQTCLLCGTTCCVAQQTCLLCLPAIHTVYSGLVLVGRDNHKALLVNLWLSTQAISERKWFYDKVQNHQEPNLSKYIYPCIHMFYADYSVAKGP